MLPLSRTPDYIYDDSIDEEGQQAGSWSCGHGATLRGYGLYHVGRRGARKARFIGRVPFIAADTRQWVPVVVGQWRLRLTTSSILLAGFSMATLTTVGHITSSPESAMSIFPAHGVTLRRFLSIIPFWQQNILPDRVPIRYGPR